MKTKILELTKQEASSFYVYQKDIIINKITDLKTNLNIFEPIFSIKTNPFIEVLKIMNNNDVGFDAASANEVMKVYSINVSKEKILYSAVGKTKDDILKTIDKSILIADSLNEINLINEIATTNDIKVKIGVRLNPDFSMSNDALQSSKFGIDIKQFIENLPNINKYTNLEIIGIHVHLKSQILDEDILKQYYENIIELSNDLIINHDIKLDFINFGGGIGIGYNKEDATDLQLSTINNYLKNILINKPHLKKTRLIVESGRFLIGQSGYFVTPIVDIKVSNNQTYYITRHGLNAFIRLSILELLNNYSTTDKLNQGSEPLYTSQNMYEITTLTNKTTNEKEIVNIVGSLCTQTDVIANNIEVVKAEIGDYVIVNNAGCYAYTLSPLLFSSFEHPKEYII